MMSGFDRVSIIPQPDGLDPDDVQAAIVIFTSHHTLPVENLCPAMGEQALAGTSRSHFALAAPEAFSRRWVSESLIL